MATNPSTAPVPTATALPQVRPLQREGAVILYSAAEQALEEAMLRSSPEPDPSDTLLSKQTRDPNDTQDGNDTEPDDDRDAPTTQPLAFTASNIRAVTLRYASQKKLCTDQHGELDAFLQVSTLLPHVGTCV